MDATADARTAAAPDDAPPEWATRYDAADFPRQAVTGDAVALALAGPGAPEDARLVALVVERGNEPFAGRDAWPGGFLDWATDADTRETAVRELREETGVRAPEYVEALASYSTNGRDPRQFAGHVDAEGRWVATGARTTTAAYLMLMGRAVDGLQPEEGEDAAAARWTDVYEYLPWEDLRRPAGLAAVRRALERLDGWARGRGGDRRERIDQAFGFALREWNEERVPERFALLLEAGLLPEARRDRWGRPLPCPGCDGLGREMAFDHRRILADALGRLRGKIKYLPAALEALMPDAFTLDELQAACEAIAGRRLHRPNFRRAVAAPGDRPTRAPRIVERTGRRRPRAAGEPGVAPELFRFLPDAGRARLDTSLRLPWLAVAPEASG